MMTGSPVSLSVSISVDRARDRVPVCRKGMWVIAVIRYKRGVAGSPKPTAPLTTILLDEDRRLMTHAR